VLVDWNRRVASELQATQGTLIIIMPSVIIAFIKHNQTKLVVNILSYYGVADEIVAL